MQRYTQFTSLTAVLAAATMVFLCNSAQAVPADGCPADETLTPIMMTHTLPPYPPISIFANEEGATTLTVVIDENGNVADDFLFETSGSKYLDDAALQFVKEKWKWKPVTLNCKPMAARTRIRITWDLHYTEDRARYEYPYLPFTMAESDYPPEALGKKEEGITGVLISYSTTGVPIAWFIMHSSGHKDLDEAAAKIAMQRYAVSPMKMTGQPIKSGAFYAMEWKLPNIGKH